MYRFFKAFIVVAISLLILPVACKKKDNPTTPAEPTATFTFTFTQTETPYSHTMTPTVTFTPTVTSSPTDTSTLTATVTPTVTFSPTDTLTPTATVTPTVTSTPTVTFTSTAYTWVGVWAGQVGVVGSTNGNGANASFTYPTGIAVGTISGNEIIYVADNGNNLIRKIVFPGVFTSVTTLAGSGLTGFADGTGNAASFNNPTGVAIDTSGNVYVADCYNHLIRKITSGGEVTTLAGSGTWGYSDGIGTAASFHNPYGVAVDASGNIYVADWGNHSIRKITSGGVVTTLAGSGSAGSADGTGTAASFRWPHGVAVDTSGNVYVADTVNNLIRKITSGGVVTTLAGSGSPGSDNGTGIGASFNQPKAIAVDGAGNVYVADSGNNLIRKITSGGVVTTEAGSGSPGFADGFGPNAEFNNPSGIAIGTHIYVADPNNELIRTIWSL